MKQLLGIAACCALLGVGTPGPAQSVTALSQCAGTMTPAAVDAAIDHLIGEMTPGERISQMGDRAPGIDRLHIPAYNWWNEGLHGIARNGHATVFPQAIGLAASWDPGLLRAVGETVSTEARARFNPHIGQATPRYGGLTLWSPNINIFRDPRWGRGQETYGEDPFLTASLGVAFVHGVQGDDPYYLRADATPKHFAVHSGPEEGRDSFNSKVTAHDLEETYLPAFHALLTEGGAAAMMCSYNAINGVPSCANTSLLRSRVRGDWGFKGYIVSDCDAVGNLSSYQHYSTNKAQAAAAALHAGVDLDCGNSYNALAEATAQGLVTQSEVDASLHRLLAARLRLGMLQPAECTAYNRIPETAVATPEHRALALRAEEESIVLLHNQGVLPLRPHTRLAVVGPNADSLQVLEANYHGTAVDPVTPLAGLRRLFPDLRYAQGSVLAEGVTIPVPETALRHGAAMRGLHVAWYSNGTLAGAAVAEADVRTVDLDINRASPAAALHGGPYSARWTGYFVPPAPGDYTLHVAIERCWDCKPDEHDGFRLMVGNQSLSSSGPHEPDRIVLHAADTTPLPLMLEFEHVGLDEGLSLEWDPPAAVLLEEAAAIVRDADAIVAFVGLSPNLEGEALSISVPGFRGGDRTSLALPRPQIALLREMQHSGKPVIVVLLSGSAVALPPDGFGAVLEVWYPGEEGGNAIANVLSGKVSPSGRLPITFYRTADQLPPFVDYSMKGRTYRYFTGDALYPFGAGLSYTTFRFGHPRLGSHRLSPGRDLRVTFTASNNGARAASVVAQVYLSPVGESHEPLRTLLAFRRVLLKSGETRTIALTIPASRMKTIGANGEALIRAGTYRLFVGDGQPGADSKGASVLLQITG
ncbi:beta-glucosidase [Bryocella elongata]|uniref:Beta-glucosidase n=1 Tax=Bryocella elongata TaxID=863522 RepID=A0A1H5UPQ8_9BACT|nr:glycoside hydrolase family 3 C-terminal domain-containing protein [Bryocella elongata]SEF77062.1 beta-glucosidase [Bryocella elongata]